MTRTSCELSLPSFTTAEDGSPEGAQKAPSHSQQGWHVEWCSSDRLSSEVLGMAGVQEMSGLGLRGRGPAPGGPV